MTETLTIFDRGCAAYLVASGVPLERVIDGDWQRFEFRDDEGRATAGLAAWKDGSAVVRAREYWRSFKTLRMVTVTSSSRRTANEEVNECGAGEQCA